MLICSLAYLQGLSGLKKKLISKVAAYQPVALRTRVLITYA